MLVFVFVFVLHTYKRGAPTRRGMLLLVNHLQERVKMRMDEGGVERRSC